MFTLIKSKIYTTLLCLLIASSISSCSIISDSLRPTAKAYYGPVIRTSQKFYSLDINRTITLDASSSYHSDKSITDLTFFWELTKSPTGFQINNNSTWNSQGAVTTFKANVGGEYRFKLTVSDAKKNSISSIITLDGVEQLPTVSFLAIGDMGKGNQHQYTVAKAMKDYCVSQHCDFVMGLGDNIYSAGVSSLNDQQFTTKFEKPYKDIALPFYMVLGNHDNSGIFGGDGSFNYRGDLQVLYARKKNRPSEKWQMPARYYQVQFPQVSEINNKLLDIYGLDSTPLTSLHDPSSEFNLKKVSKKQGGWFSSKVKQSLSHWRIAFAHHPYLSNGEHGNAGKYDNANLIGGGYVVKRIAGVYFKDFLETYVCGEVDLFISGHDHTLQDLKLLNQCGKTEFIVSGAAASATTLSNNKNPKYWQSDKLGFFHVLVKANSIIIRGINVHEDGTFIIKHQRILTK